MACAEVIIASAAIVQALAMVFLAVLTWRYVKHTSDLVRQARSQADQYRADAADKAKRGVKAIFDELNLNLEGTEWRGSEAPPLVSAQYGANALSLIQAGAGNALIRAVGEAHRAIKHYTLLLHFAFEERRRGESALSDQAQAWWSKAQTAIQEAITCLKQDPATKEIVGSGHPGA